jgi:hypothetical protein
MADLVLKSGKEVNIDLDAFSEREWREALEEKDTQSKLEGLAARACGMTVEEFLGMTKLDTKRFWPMFIKKVREPLSDPN